MRPQPGPSASGDRARSLNALPAVAVPCRPLLEAEHLSPHAAAGVVPDAGRLGLAVEDVRLVARAVHPALDDRGGAGIAGGDVLPGPARVAGGGRPVTG